MYFLLQIHVIVKERKYFCLVHTSKCQRELCLPSDVMTVECRPSSQNTPEHLVGFGIYYLQVGFGFCYLQSIFTGCR